METVKVLLANRPRMLRESLRSVIEGHDDIEVEAVEPDPVTVLAAVDRAAADVVVIALPDSGEDPGLCSHLLTEYPDLLVLALSTAEANAFAYRQVITKEELQPPSTASILACIRRRHQEKPTSGQDGFGQPLRLVEEKDF